MKFSTKNQILKLVPQEPRTLDEVAHTVIAVVNSYVERRVNSRGKITVSQPVQVVGFTWDLRWSDCVSNTHSSPEGMPQNWHGNEIDKEGNPLPKGYPGWTGRVWIRYADSPISFGSDPLRNTLTHTGTGGAGSYNGPWSGLCSAHWHRFGRRREKENYPRPECFSWDYRIYARDWPLLEDQMEKERMWAILSNKQFSPDHKFLWTDPAVLAADQEFLAECHKLNTPVRPS